MRADRPAHQSRQPLSVLVDLSAVRSPGTTCYGQGFLLAFARAAVNAHALVCLPEELAAKRACVRRSGMLTSSLVPWNGCGAIPPAPRDGGTWSRAG
jgi:hypothetical protein